MIDFLKTKDLFYRSGTIIEARDLLLIATGPNLPIGSSVNISQKIIGTVVGYDARGVLIMPNGPVSGVKAGDVVENRLQPPPSISLGSVVDSLGKRINEETYNSEEEFIYSSKRPDPLERRQISSIFPTGVRAIDGITTVGLGQRMGIFSSAGLGKTTMMGMIARHSIADVNVIGLIGERGREVGDFLSRDLGEKIDKSVVVVATSDEHPMSRLNAAELTQSIAEHYRNKGKNVLMLLDSLTRLAHAKREVGLILGEPPTTRGFPPSVFTMFPALVERAGTAPVGSITAFYTFLTDGDGTADDPIADHVKSILDGHIVLDRRIAESGIYPPLNITKSISRLMPDIVSEEHNKKALTIRKAISLYEEYRDAIEIGAYRGGNQDIDNAIAVRAKMDSFMNQSPDDESSFEKTLGDLYAI